ncbi:MAG: TonB-dependent receptor, partial [Gammaproteobacteria bacterium]
WAAAPTAENPWRWMPSNINKAQIDGVEMELSTQIYGWDVSLNGDVLSPKNRITNARLEKRSQMHLTADLSRELVDGFYVGSTLAVSNDRLEGTTKLHGSVVWDLRAAYELNNHWTLKGKLNNLLNDQYQTSLGYNTADRNFFFSVNFKH